MGPGEGRGPGRGGGAGPSGAAGWGEEAEKTAGRRTETHTYTHTQRHEFSYVLGAAVCQPPACPLPTVDVPLTTRSLMVCDADRGGGQISHRCRELSGQAGGNGGWGRWHWRRGWRGGLCPREGVRKA